MLLEDPGHRLRAGHCDDVLHSRIPHAYTQYAAAGPGSDGGTSSPIYKVLQQQHQQGDQSILSIFRLEAPGDTAILVGAAGRGSAVGDNKGSSEGEIWPHLLVQLDAAELAKRCGLRECQPVGVDMRAVVAARMAAACEGEADTARDYGRGGGTGGGFHQQHSPGRLVSVGVMTSPRLMQQTAAARGATASPGLPKFLFEYESPVAPFTVHTPSGGPHSGMPSGHQQPAINGGTNGRHQIAPSIGTPLSALRGCGGDAIPSPASSDLMGAPDGATAFGSLVHRVDNGGIGVARATSLSSGGPLGGFGSVGSVVMMGSPNRQHLSSGSSVGGAHPTATSGFSSRCSESPPSNGVNCAQDPAGEAPKSIFSYLPKDVSSCWGNGAVPSGFSSIFGGGAVNGGGGGLRASDGSEQQSRGAGGRSLFVGYAGGGVGPSFNGLNPLGRRNVPSPSSALDTSCSSALGCSHGSSAGVSCTQASCCLSGLFRAEDMA